MYQPGDDLIFYSGKPHALHVTRLILALHNVTGMEHEPVVEGEMLLLLYNIGIPANLSNVGTGT